VGSQVSGVLPGFKSNYSEPKIESVELFRSVGRTSRWTPGSQPPTTLLSLDTRGGDVIVFRGSNFGAHGVDNNVFADSSRSGSLKRKSTIQQVHDGIRTVLHLAPPSCVV
jgi:hypothetical protein